MKSLTVNTLKPYDILVGADILPQLGKTLKNLFSPKKIAIITDDIVNTLYQNTVTETLKNQGFSVSTFVFPNGETSKNLGTYEKILNFLTAEGITRSDIILALGGGVVGDIAGFAAATYLRGIPYIQVPTTFLAAIDSSVGGKTGVNLNSGKNQVGAFYQPSFVFCDYNTMKTMEPNRFADGVAEAIKYGVLADKELFSILAKGEIWENMESIILACLTIKKNLVLEDEFDKGNRQLLNLGHTLGHAIEKESNFDITHGHAVAMGMALIANISKVRGLSFEDCETPITEALKANNLPTESPFAMARLIDAMKQDKKRDGNLLTFVIPQTIGSCVLHPVAIENLEEFITIGV